LAERTSVTGVTPQNRSTPKGNVRWCAFWAGASRMRDGIETHQRASLRGWRCDRDRCDHARSSFPSRRPDPDAVEVIACGQPQNTASTVSITDSMPTTTSIAVNQRSCGGGFSEPIIAHPRSPAMSPAYRINRDAVETSFRRPVGGRARHEVATMLPTCTM
jgi:hypothetical protein